MALTFDVLWLGHPYPDDPCEFENQCAIRMGVALRAAGVQFNTFAGARCWHNHRPPHILRAQELANWLDRQVSLVGRATKKRSATSADFAGKRGIVFIRDGWGSTDHIDLWNGARMKGGDPSYFERGKGVWFWELT